MANMKKTHYQNGNASRKQTKLQTKNELVALPSGFEPLTPTYVLQHVVLYQAELRGGKKKWGQSYDRPTESVDRRMVGTAPNGRLKVLSGHGTYGLRPLCLGCTGST